MPFCSRKSSSSDQLGAPSSARRYRIRAEPLQDQDRMSLGKDQIDQDALAAEWGVSLEADVVAASA
jgi:hypothetical protein